MINKCGNIQTFLGCDADYNSADLVIFGAPYDGTTTNKPGARFGPAAMRADSWGLESYSPYCERDLEDFAIYDAGDLDLPMGDSNPVLERIEAAITDIAKDGKIPLMLGGEHLVTLGAIRALHRVHPDLHIIHFDAHADLRDEYIGNKLSHSTVIRHCWDLLGDNKIFQFGIRSGERAEFDWAKNHTVLRKFDLAGLDDILGNIIGRPIYFTLDLDVLDSGIFWGTGTPEAGGISFAELLAGIGKFAGQNLVGADIVELAPNLDISGQSTATACKILRELILTITKER